MIVFIVLIGLAPNLAIFAGLANFSAASTTISAADAWTAHFIMAIPQEHDYFE
jgi:hypothetical protein